MSLNRFRLRMAEEISKTKLGSSSSSTAAVADSSAAAAAATNAAKSRWKILWPNSLRWVPTSTDYIIAAEKRLLSILKYTFLSLSLNYTALGKIELEILIDSVSATLPDDIKSISEFWFWVSKFQTLISCLGCISSS